MTILSPRERLILGAQGLNCAMFSSRIKKYGDYWEEKSKEATDPHEKEFYRSLSTYAAQVDYTLYTIVKMIEDQGVRIPFPLKGEK